MGVSDPGKNQGYAGEDNGGEEESKIPDCDGLLGCEEDVANCCYQASACYERPTYTNTIGDECTCDDADEAEDVRWCRETIRLNG